jgi:two-component system response regulator HydG
MRAHDLELSALLDIQPETGVVQFAGQRALLLDAVAMGLLRKYLFENFGLTAARTVLTQFGFAHGWRMAEALKTAIDWDSDQDWRDAGTRIHALQGLFQLDTASGSPLSKEGLTLANSYEAEQHLLHFGRSDVPVCWTICGLTSGYLSHSEGREIYVLEDRCVGKGDPACHLMGRTREEWGDERAEELRFFEAKRLQECLDVSLQRVTETLKAAERRLRQRRRALVRVDPDAREPMGLVTRSPSMRKVLDLARRVAKVDSTLLITGETGSGKERIARLLHDESHRASGPFIAVNCGAIAESLLESELFGHVRGSFTGATLDRAGLFEAANRGTLLLDEVGEISPAMQVKLLRVLQEREVRRVGDNTARRIDVRVLAATNRDLAAGVANGTFRQDLYYRLKVIELRVPPLRERKDDILPLARVLLTDLSLRMKRKSSGIPSSVADQLMRYEWPGNVRELENCMEHALALTTGTWLSLDDLPEEVRNATPRPVVTISGEYRRLDEVEKDHILATLALHGGNQTRTAEALGIGTATLYRKLKSYGRSS